MNKESKNVAKTRAAKTLFALACLVTVVALFYLEEDWRGKSDWSNYRHEQEAKGEKFDWLDFAPAPVPDDQNFAMSPVWISRIKYSQPETAENWYGDRINGDDVAKFYGLNPISASALVGTNWANYMPATPKLPVCWTASRRVNLSPWQSYYRNLEEANSDAEIRITPQPQSPGADVLLALDKFDEPIEQLRRDSKMPYSRFPVQYDIGDPAEILLPHLAALKGCAQVLELRAIAELQTGQPDKAYEDVILVLRLGDSVRTEPFIITHLVRMAMMQMAIQSIYEGLAAHQWSDAQLAAMDQELVKLDYIADFQFCMHTECAAHARIWDWVAEKRSRATALLEMMQQYSQYSGNHWRGPNLSLAAAGFFVTPRGWFYQTDILLAQEQERWAAAVDDKQQVVSPKDAQRADEAVQAIANHPDTFKFLSRFLASDNLLYAKRTAFAQQSAELARIAIALERYHLAKGTYPSSLDALAPEFMQEVPHDVINGEPLNYRTTADGQFVLYSVGWNQTNDGGVAVAGNSIDTDMDIDKGDWVWRYPEK